MKKSLFSFFIILTLFFLVLYVPMSYSSDMIIVLDPPIQNVRRWDNAWTETFIGNGNPPFKTVVHSGPQVLWNGTGWVKYELTPINESYVILKTPVCGYIIGTAAISLFDPSLGVIRVNSMKWNIEQYSGILDTWLPMNLKDSLIGYNTTHVWQSLVFTDNSEQTLFIGYDNKQTVIFNSKSSATYRLTWGFNSVDATSMFFQSQQHP